MLMTAQRGLPPVYDQRLKISEADFRRYLVIQQELQPSGKTVRLSVLRDATRLLFGDAGGTSLLRGISLDLATGEMRFPEGFTARPEALVDLGGAGGGRRRSAGQTQRLRLDRARQQPRHPDGRSTAILRCCR